MYAYYIVHFDTFTFSFQMAYHCHWNSAEYTFSAHWVRFGFISLWNTIVCREFDCFHPRLDVRNSTNAVIFGSAQCEEKTKPKESQENISIFSTIFGNFLIKPVYTMEKFFSAAQYNFRWYWCCARLPVLNARHYFLLF